MDNFLTGFYVYRDLLNLIAVDSVLFELLNRLLDRLLDQLVLLL